MQEYSFQPPITSLVSMSTSEDVPLNLASVPSDIIRKIIEHVELSTIDNVRLISPRFNSLVLERLSNRKNLPKVTYLRWLDYSKGSFLTMTFSYEYRGFFGVENWERELNLSKTDPHDYVKLQSQNLQRFLQNGKHALDRISRIFNRISSIERLDLETNLCSNEFATIKEAMATLPVRELSISSDKHLDLFSEQSILSLLRSSRFPVHRLMVSPFICRSQLDNPSKILTRYTCGPFLFEAVRLVSEIVIEEIEIATGFWNRVEEVLNGTGKVTAKLFATHESLGLLCYRLVITAPQHVDK